MHNGTQVVGRGVDGTHRVSRFKFSVLLTLVPPPNHHWYAD